ncbi:MAG: fimbrillin family protein, partial [Bacteroidaceae bacterium]|nr:fimbrillin family protein [Bacteroidaceae bacterium]
MAVACQDKKDSEPLPTPTPGADVCFGGELEENGVSRTIYGGEVTGEGGAYSFPILWVWNKDPKKNDQVFIASPQCPQNMNSGVFAVTQDANNRAYAGSFEKKSGTIQWGSTDADFYSIYPTRDGDFEVKTATGFSATNPTFELNMPSEQTCMVAGTTPVMTTADMYACFMYAKSLNVQNGTSPVKLKYTPFSTAIRFTLRGPDTQLSASTVDIERIRLIGPSGTALSGKFQVKLGGFDESGQPINDPVVTPVSGATSNIVTVYARYANDAYLQLSNGQEIELNAFIIPQKGMTVDGNWKIEVVLSSGKVYSKTLTKKTTASNTTLLPGMIHRLGDLPKLLPSDLDPAKWMEFIPRNVYLSEISIPGSWNSLNSEFQGSNPSISSQYTAGVRMYHLDTRFRAPESTAPTNLETDWTLGVATGDKTYTMNYSGSEYDGKVMRRDACEDFSTYLTQITNNVKSTEYMVLLCTFA